jgi:hypothetical protein
MLLCGLGLAIPGQIGYDGKPGRTWIVWSGCVSGGIDDGGPGKLTLSAALSDPFLNFLEDVGDVEGQMVRRCRHHRDFCPALRELPLKDGQRQLGSDFGLPGEDRDHPRFKASFGLPHEALKGLVRFTAPAHPVRKGLRLDAGQFGRRLAIAPTTDGVQDDGCTVIRQLGLAAL